jgi:ketosteroid isomerase-like protein
MKTGYWLLTTAFLVATSVANAQTLTDTVNATNKAFMDAYNGKDSKAVSELYTKDATAFPPNMVRVKGRENIAKLWQGAMDAGMTDLKLICDEVKENGDSGYDTGTYSIKVPMKDGKMAADGTPTEVTGKYVVVWMKEDGAWKLHRDIWNDDPAK